jgi:hypothetical protein
MEVHTFTWDFRPLTFDVAMEDWEMCPKGGGGALLIRVMA